MFVKDDKNKIRPTLLVPDFIEDVVKVLEFGANKYGKGNWQKVDDINRYKDALFRHLLSYLKGEKVDSDTNVSHLAHIACNAMFLHYLDKQNKGEKDEEK